MMVHAIEDTEISIGNSYIAEMATILDSFYQPANNHKHLFGVVGGENG